MLVFCVLNIVHKCFALKTNLCISPLKWYTFYFPIYNLKGVADWLFNPICHGPLGRDRFMGGHKVPGFVKSSLKHHLTMKFCIYPQDKSSMVWSVNSKTKQNCHHHHHHHFICKINKLHKEYTRQAGAELCQAQESLGLSGLD